MIFIQIVMLTEPEVKVIRLLMTDLQMIPTNAFLTEMSQDSMQHQAIKLSTSTKILISVRVTRRI